MTGVSHAIGTEKCLEQRPQHVLMQYVMQCVNLMFIIFLLLGYFWVWGVIFEVRSSDEPKNNLKISLALKKYYLVVSRKEFL